MRRFPERLPRRRPAAGPAAAAAAAAGAAAAGAAEVATRRGRPCPARAAARRRRLECAFCGASESPLGVGERGGGRRRGGGGGRRCRGVRDCATSSDGSRALASGVSPRCRRADAAKPCRGLPPAAAAAASARRTARGARRAVRPCRLLPERAAPATPRRALQAPRPCPRRKNPPCPAYEPCPRASARTPRYSAGGYSAGVDRAAMPCRAYEASSSMPRHAPPCRGPTARHAPPCQKVQDAAALAVPGHVPRRRAAVPGAQARARGPCDDDVHLRRRAGELPPQNAAQQRIPPMDALSIACHGLACRRPRQSSSTTARGRAMACRRPTPHDADGRGRPCPRPRPRPRPRPTPHARGLGRPRAPAARAPCPRGRALPADAADSAPASRPHAHGRPAQRRRRPWPAVARRSNACVARISSSSTLRTPPSAGRAQPPHARRGVRDEGGGEAPSALDESSAAHARRAPTCARATRGCTAPSGAAPANLGTPQQDVVLPAAHWSPS